MGVLLRWISFRHLFRERRAWLTLIGVALGISVFISIRIANQSVLSTYRHSVNTVAGNTTLEVVGRAGPFDETIIAPIRETPGVRSVAPIVHAALPMTSPPSTQGEILFLMGVDLLQEGAFRQYEIGGGEPQKIFTALMEPDAVLLTEPFARRHRIEIGGTISVREGDRLLPFRVAGFLKGRGLSEAEGGNIGIVDIASAQWRLGKLGRLDRIDLITDAQTPLGPMIQRLSAQLGPAFSLRRPEQRSEQVEKMLFAFQLNLTALSAISLFVGIFLIYNTLLVSVVHRRKEIGILRSLGVTRLRIFSLFLLEGMLLGTIGGIGGVVLGSLLARAILRLVARTVSALYVPIPPSPFSLPPSVFWEGIGIGIVVAALSSLFPALQAGLLRPREAMEGIYASPQRPSVGRFLIAAAAFGGIAYLLSQVPLHWNLPFAGYLSAAFLLITFSMLVPPGLLLFSRLIGPLLGHLPPAWRLAQGHLEQAMRRNGPTIAAFMGALAMMISVVIMIESFRDTVVLWIDQTIKADIVGAPASLLSKGSEETLPNGLLSEVRQTEGVDAVDGYRSLQLLYREEPALLVGRDLAVHAARSRYLFRSGDSNAILQKATREGKMLVSEVFANRFGLREGEIVDLPSPEGKIPLEIAGIFYEYSTDGGKMVIDRSLLQRIWKDDRLNVIAIYLKNGFAPNAVRQQLVQHWGAERGLTFITQVNFKKEILRIFDQTFLVTYALEWIAVVVALLGITNTLFVSILERQREIGILRAIGASRRQVVQVVLIEAFYMGVIGNILSLFCGLFLSLLLIFVINKQSFGWTLLYHYPPSVILHSFLLATVTALLAGYFPARKAAQLEVTEAISYE
ncbi:MAG: FtsX-like permease family protein [Nitrospirae bacterium]|nr:FtsX-like permease family protein [Candidatus Manganitrophaceae bacterium]